MLNSKLNESGWTDDIRHRSKGCFQKDSFDPVLMLINRTSEEHGPTIFSDVVRRDTPSRPEYAQPFPYFHLLTLNAASIPLAVKREATTLIRQNLEKHVA